MEIQDGAIFYRNVVEKVVRKNNYIQLKLRKWRSHPFVAKQKSYVINVVWISDDEAAKRLYWAAQRLKSGDTIWVELFHDEWRDPAYSWLLRRWWNKLFH